MMELSDVKKMIQAAFPDADVEVVDQTGTQDHFGIYVESQSFEGKKLIEQHRMVQAAVQEAMNDGRIHAVQIKTVVVK